MKNAGTLEDTLRYQMVGLLPRLRSFARSLTKDPDRADDLVQAACERALERLDQLAEGTRLDSWLYRIIYTRWIDKVRRQKTRSAKLVLISEQNKSSASDSDSGDHLVAALDLQNALNALPEEHHAALALVCVEGYSYAEAASVLEVPAGTVASRVARARTKLNTLLFSEPSQTLQTVKRERMEGEK
jgi:RNA polymerase sigma-70 factor (ECF subfamily)